ncbi:MAG: hypothetical protein OQL09_02190 [Gammaproteobacteria bacterium]|nr:hypothetical protein [Gammaproteobacteria bacterium]
MGRHIFLSVLGFSILAVVLGVWLSSMMDPRPHSGFPWQIESQADGSIRVFSLVLGQSTLADAEQQFKEGAEITMFVPKDSEAVVEAYFNELTIGGLKSKMVVAFDLDSEQLQAMYDGGVRISTMGSGTRKVMLNSDHLQQVRQSVISGLTYMPSINLTAEFIQHRFGNPDQKIKDPDGDAIHWLYADKGVDVALSEQAKEVIQYVHPANFDRIRSPLIETSPSINHKP